MVSSFNGKKYTYSGVIKNWVIRSIKSYTFDLVITIVTMADAVLVNFC